MDDFEGFKTSGDGAPGSRSRLSVRLQPGHDLAVREFEPRVRLCADSSEPGACFRFWVSLSLSAPPPPILPLSVSQKKNTLTLKKYLRIILFTNSQIWKYKALPYSKVQCTLVGENS